MLKNANKIMLLHQFCEKMLTSLKDLIIKRGNFLVHVWARSSAGEHCFDVAGVSGSIPLGPTMFLLRLVCLR